MPNDFDYSIYENPRRGIAASRVPLITYFLCFASIFATSIFLGGDALKNTPFPRLAYAFAPNAQVIWEGGYYALLTTCFVHGSIIHILFNLMWLYRIGSVLEMTLPTGEYLLILLGSMFVGSCAELAFSGQAGIGMSGVVYALFGLMWAGRGRFAEWRNIATSDTMKLFIGWGIFCVLATYLRIFNIANAAHFGGLLFGMSVGWLFYSPRRRPLWAIPLALLILICVLSLTWMPWSATWTEWKGDQALVRKNFPAAINWYEKSIQRGGSPYRLWSNIAETWLTIAADSRRQNRLQEARAAEQQANRAMIEAENAFERILKKDPRTNTPGGFPYERPPSTNTPDTPEKKDTTDEL